MSIKVEQSETFKDVQIATSTHPAERNLTHLTWDELENIVEQGQELLRRRSTKWDCGLTESERAAIRNGEDLDYHEEID